MIQKSLFLLFMLAFTGNFKSDQIKFKRVKEAYSSKLNYLENITKSVQISLSEIRIYLCAFKEEGILQVWVQNSGDTKYKLLTTYEICSSSGILGPKRKEGDLQVPEGFYQINHFNPESNFHLSLGINYPNLSDQVFADKKNPGGAIYIHGNCVTIGCLPITDDKIKELYILAVEARNNGQENIPVNIYPARMTPKNIEKIKQLKSYPPGTLTLWEDLKTSYDYFEKYQKPPIVKFLKNGRHSFH